MEAFELDLTDSEKAASLKYLDLANKLNRWLRDIRARTNVYYPPEHVPDYPGHVSLRLGQCGNGIDAVLEPWDEMRFKRL